MFGMGWPEIFVIVIVATFVFGPERLPELARQAGRFLRTLKQMVDNAKSDLADEMGEEFSGLKEMNLRDMDPREIARRNIVEAMEDEGTAADQNGTADTRDGTGDGTQVGQRPLKPGERAPYDFDAT